MAVRIGINGFGRIGRLVYRICAAQGIEVVAVNDLVPADNLAYLLKYDTMHRQFMLGGKPAEISATESSFTVNGYTTKTMAEKDPAKLPWKDLKVDYVIESTGLFTEFEKASLQDLVNSDKKRYYVSPKDSHPNHLAYDEWNGELINWIEDNQRFGFQL